MCLGAMTVNLEDWTVLQTEGCPEYNKKKKGEADAEEFGARNYKFIRTRFNQRFRPWYSKRYSST